MLHQCLLILGSQRAVMLASQTLHNVLNQEDGDGAAIPLSKSLNVQQTCPGSATRIGLSRNGHTSTIHQFEHCRLRSLHLLKQMLRYANAYIGSECLLQPRVPLVASII